MDPKQPVVLLAVFMLSLSAFSNLLIATGVADTIGISTPPEDKDFQEDVRAATNNGTVQTGSPGGETLFGMYNLLSKSLRNILGLVNPELTLLENAGVPAFLTNFLEPIVLVAKVLGVVWFIRGL